MAEHMGGMSHDQVSYFLWKEKYTPSQLWNLVSSHIEDSEKSVIIADDSVQDKRYSRFIELVKKQYSGNEHGLVSGIGILNFVHSSGNDGDYFPINYRIYHPETDGKTKNDHFREMFLNLVSHKQLKAHTILFDAWYASVDNLKLIHRQGWTFFTTLKSNRKVSLSIETGYQHLQDIVFDEKTLVNGLLVKLKEVPFMIKLFKLVAPNGNIEWVITNDTSPCVNCFVAELKNDNRWQIEEFHRSFKQLTGSEKCQCRKARSQRNHLACCYFAWVNLKLQALKNKQTIYQVRKYIFADFLSEKLKTASFNIII
jgi:hypothetical protein